MSLSGPDNLAHGVVLYHLSDFMGIGVFSNNEKIGAIDDFVIVDKDKVAVVTHICVERSFGRPKLFVPWDNVKEISLKKAVVEITAAESLAHPLPGNPVLLKDFILDKKVLDVAEREVEVVYDILLSLRNHILLVVEVEISRFALLRRMGLGWLSNLLYRSALRTSANAQVGGAPIERRQSHRTVPWSYVQALTENIESFKCNIKLKILKDQLSKIATPDVADILEELDPEQRTAVFHELDTDHASDTLASLNPKFQRDLVATLKKEKAAQLINEMTPGQAADLLAVLPLSEVQSILKLLDPANVVKIQNILQEQEAKIVDFTDSDFLKFSPETTVAQARAALQRAVREHNRDAIMYLYVLDAEGKLLGIVALSELLLADDQTELHVIMRKEVIKLSPENTMKEASKLFARYGLRAIPVLDGVGKMIGILPYRDVLNLRQKDLG